MLNEFGVAFVSAAVLATASPAAAIVLCVNPGGTGGCFASIVAAINAAPSAGTVIHVAAGTYVESFAYVASRGIAIQGVGADVTTWTSTSDPSRSIRQDRLLGEAVLGQPIAAESS